MEELSVNDFPSLIPCLSAAKSVCFANTKWQTLLKKGGRTRKMWNIIEEKNICHSSLTKLKDYVFSALKGKLV